MSWLGKLGLGGGTRRAGRRRRRRWRRAPTRTGRHQGASSQFGAGCFWGVELAFQRVPGVTRTEVGYSQGGVHGPTYEDVCTGDTGHNEVVCVHFDPAAGSYGHLLDTFWARHDPTTPNRQGNDVGSPYRSGIYYYTPEQEKAARVPGEATEAPEPKDRHRDPPGKEVLQGRGVPPAVPGEGRPPRLQAVCREGLQRPHPLLRMRDERGPADQAHRPRC